MMKDKKTKWAPLLWAVILLFATACGDGSDENSTGDTNSGGTGAANVSTANYTDTDVIDINSTTFSENGYFFIARDGDRVEKQSYQSFEFNNPAFDNSTQESTTYLWWDGTEAINGFETLKRYSSEAGFDTASDTISYGAYIDNEFREFKQDHNVVIPELSFTYVYTMDPYSALPLDLIPGDTFTHTYTEKETDGNQMNSVRLTISEVANDTVTTYFDTYDDCIRYNMEVEYIVADSITISEHEMIYWFCRGAGQVRVVDTVDGPDGYTSTLDTNDIFN